MVHPTSAFFNVKNLQVPRDNEAARENILISIEFKDAMLARFQPMWYTEYLLALRPQHHNSFDPGSYLCEKHLTIRSVVLI